MEIALQWEYDNGIVFLHYNFAYTDFNCSMAKIYLIKVGTLLWDIINLVVHLSQAPGWPAVDFIHTVAITLGMPHATGREF